MTFHVDPSGRYIVGYALFGSAATLLSIDSTTGALTPTTLPPFNYGPAGSLLDRSGLFGYVFEAGAGAIHPYQIDPIGLDAYELPVMSNGVALRGALIVGTQ